MVTGARALVDCLLREGIDHVFGIPGTQNLPILDALHDTPQIRFILTRHEQGAGFMAFGYARASGGPSVLTVTEGPGVCNLPLPIGAAFKAFTPVIGINGNQEHWLRERDGQQDMDQVTFFKPITKWAYTMPSASKVQEAVRKAFRVALAEPLGPVHLEADRDVYLDETEVEAIEPEAYRATSLPDCNSEVLDRAAAMLAKAERPIFIVGTGVLRERATRAMIELAELTGIPVTAIQYSPDAFPTSHPLALGALGRNSWGPANRTLPGADVIVAVGVRFDLNSTTFKYGLISADAKIIHQNPAPSALGVSYPVALPVAGSTASFISGLSERLKRAGRQWSWVDTEKLRAEWRSERMKEVNATAEPIQGPFVAHTVRKVLPPNGMLVIDAGNGVKNMRTQLETYEPGTYIGFDDWGSVGGSLPTAIGAKLARPDRPVVACLGDMGMMCNIGELETAVREKVPVVCVVSNDQGLGNERAYQNAMYGGRIYGVDYQNPDFGALARVFGAYGEQVQHPADLEGAVRRALDSGRPAVLDVLIDKSLLQDVLFKA